MGPKTGQQELLVARMAGCQKEKLKHKMYLKESIHYPEHVQIKAVSLEESVWSMNKATKDRYGYRNNINVGKCVPCVT